MANEFENLAAAAAGDVGQSLPAYLRILSHTSLQFGGGAIYRPVASEPPHSAKIQKNGQWYEATDCEGIDVKVMGARGNNDNNDTQALQNALERAEETSNNVRRSVVISKGQYRFENLTCPSPWINVVGVSPGVSRLYSYSTDPGDAIHFAGQGPRLKNIRIENADIDENTVQRYGVRFQKPNGATADVDAECDNVEISGFQHAVEHWGRGLKFQNSQISTCLHGINLNWPSLAVDPNDPNYPTYEPGTEAVQQDMAGFRGFMFQNNRAHSNLGSFIRNVGKNAKNVLGVWAIGNYSDIGRWFFEGVLRDSTLALNGSLLSPLPGLALTDGSKNSNIIGNYIGGSDNISPDRIPTNFMTMRGAIDDISMAMNFFKRCKEHGIDVRNGVVTGLSSHADTFIDPCSLVGNFCPFGFNGAGHKASIIGTKISTVNTLKGVAVTTSSMADVRVGGTQFSKASFPLIYGPGARYPEMSHSQGITATSLPTSPAGLAPGTFWRDADGFVKVV